MPILSLSNLSANLRVGRALTNSTTSPVAFAPYPTVGGTALPQAVNSLRLSVGQPLQQRVAFGRGAAPAVVAAMTLNYPKPLVFAPQGSKAATGAVIFLHGLGDSADGWTDVAPLLQAQLPNIKFIFPTAAKLPVTINGGMLMNAWYDIASLSGINTAEDAHGLRESKRFVEELVQKEVAAGLPSDRIVVGGFSQGGAVSLLMMRSSIKLAGVVGLSTYLPLRDQPPIVSAENKDTPMFMAHGTADQVVMYAYGKLSVETLQAAGANVDFKSYRGMGHSACNEELQDLAAFLTKALP